MQACWTVEPEQRPTFSTIVQQLGLILASELAPHQLVVDKAMRSSPNGPAYAAMAASLRRQQDTKRLSDPSARGSRGAASSSRGSLRSSVAAGGSVGASSGPASPHGFAGSGNPSANGGTSAVAAASLAPNPASSF